MKQLYAIAESIGSAVLLAVRSGRYLNSLPRQFPRLVEQCYLIGYTTLPIVTILSFFIGSVLALQSGYSMQNFGAKQFIGTLVGMSMVRELGPRLVAVLIMMPVLASIANLCGWFGGALVCKYTAFISVEPDAYFAALKRFMEMKDVTDGLIKAEVFGFAVILVCCNIGLNTRGGPREIGAAVTKAVVVSLILILVLDYFVTKALIY